MDYHLIRTSRKTLALEITRDGALVVRAPFFVSRKRIESTLREKERWIRQTQAKLQLREKAAVLSLEEAKELKKRAKDTFPSRLRYLSEKYALPYGKLTITSARTRFGSCSAKNDIALSYFLAYYPDEAIDYVMVHELCHTKEHNHSKAFYEKLEQMMPDWKKRKALLNTPMPEVLKEN